MNMYKYWFIKKQDKIKTFILIIFLHTISGN